MSLITRCPACGTMFKVVTDQLKVSQGWVRCGHCSEVFDASLNLQQVAADPAFQPATEPYPSQSFAEQPAAFAPAQQVPADDTQWKPGVFFEPARDMPVQPPNYGPPATNAVIDADEFDPTGWKQQHSTPALDESGTLQLNEYGEAIRVEPASAAASPAPRRSRDAATSDEDVLNEFPLASPDASSDVSFVREARRRAMWQRPAVRAVLGMISLVLVALLGFQVLVQQRDSLAAAEPKFRPWLDSLCERVGCKVGPVRRIEAVVIDSSSFNKLDGDSYRLGFSIKNTGGTPVAMPSLEVTLTDTQDQALMRRVLAPSQLGAPVTTLNAGSDFSGAVVMQVLGFDSPGSAPAQAPVTQRVAGYRILAFYP